MVGRFDGVSNALKGFLLRVVRVKLVELNQVDSSGISLLRVLDGS